MLSACLPVDRLLGFAAGRLDQAQTNSVRDHVCACRECMMELQLATSIVPVGSAPAATRAYTALPSFGNN